jgi:hypothetical protein
VISSVLLQSCCSCDNYPNQQWRLPTAVVISIYRQLWPISRKLWYPVTGSCGYLPTGSCDINRQLWYKPTGSCDINLQAAVISIHRQLWYPPPGSCDINLQAAMISTYRQLWYPPPGSCDIQIQAAVILTCRQLWYLSIALSEDTWTTGSCDRELEQLWNLPTYSYEIYL